MSKRLNLVPNRDCGSGQRGLGLVELMVGLAVGAVVVAAALVIVAQQISASRDGAQRLRAQQDLRAVAALLNRWARQAVAVSPADPVFVLGPGRDAVHFHVVDDAAAAPAGAEPVLQPVSLRLSAGVVEWRWGPAATSRWQALTDAQSLRVERLVFEPALAAATGACAGQWSLRWRLDAEVRMGAGGSRPPLAAALDPIAQDVLVRHPVVLAPCAA